MPRSPPVSGVVQVPQSQVPSTAGASGTVSSSPTRSPTGASALPVTRMMATGITVLRVFHKYATGAITIPASVPLRVGPGTRICGLGKSKVAKTRRIT